MADYSGGTCARWFYVFNVPLYNTNLFYAVPVVSNNKIPEGKFFLQTIIL